jgi:hypothetical protein
MAGDLNLKKSWNPALVKNQRKVWDQEQEKLNEFKKIKERNEELAKEQEYINLLKLQYGDDFDEGDLTKNERLKLSKLNWMYNDQPVSTMNSSGFNEISGEFVEGKKKVEQLLLGSKSLLSNTNSNMNKIINSGKSTSLKPLADDPLAMIMSQQMKQHSSGERSRSSSRRSHRDDERRDDSHRSHRDDEKRQGSHRSHRDERHRHSSRKYDERSSTSTSSSRNRDDKHRSSRVNSSRRHDADSQSSKDPEGNHSTSRSYHRHNHRVEKPRSDYRERRYEDERHRSDGSRRDYNKSYNSERSPTRR